VKNTSQSNKKFIQHVEKISTEEVFMVFRKSNFESSRRKFIKNALPAGALFCFGCDSLLALPAAFDKQQVDTEKHPFLRDAGMTARQVFQFKYQISTIAYMKKLQKYIGKEKFIELLKKASVESDVEITRSGLEKLRKNDFDMYKMMTKSLHPPYNLARVMEIVEDTDRTYELKITECLWAQTFREADAEEIGYAMVCYSGEAQTSAFNSKLKFYNPKNLMKGDDVCIYRYVWEG
jgi:hypothetical protein